MHSAFPMSDFSGTASDILGIAWRDGVSACNWEVLMSCTHDGGATEYGFHNFKVGPEGSVYAHCNTFYDDNSNLLYMKNGLPTTVQEPAVIAPQRSTLHQNFPNPFNPTTENRFSLQQREHVTLKIFDTFGCEVAVLRNGVVEAGAHATQFDAGHLPSGVYFVQLVAGKFFETRKAALLK